MKKVVLEMGGSDAAIVCEEADLDIASSGVLWGGMANCGQNCNAIERVILLKHSAAEFTERLMAKMKNIRIGDGMDRGTDMGPLASASQKQKMESIVRKCKARGSQCLAGGEGIAGRAGYFFQPTLLYQHRSDAFPTDEEIFGPILMAACVKDDEEAVRLANQSPFGLAASVWTGNRRRGETIARKLECGSVMINDCVVSFGITESNWTGIKRSGIGWVHGEKGLDEMVNLQYINADPQNHIQKFWWFPYSEGMVRGMKAAMQFLHSSRLRKRIRALPAVFRHFTAYLLTNRIRSDKV